MMRVGRLARRRRRRCPVSTALGFWRRLRALPRRHARALLRRRRRRHQHRHLGARARRSRAHRQRRRAHHPRRRRHRRRARPHRARDRAGHRRRRRRRSRALDAAILATVGKSALFSAARSASAPCWRAACCSTVRGCAASARSSPPASPSPSCSPGPPSARASAIIGAFAAGPHPVGAGAPRLPRRRRALARRHDGAARRVPRAGVLRRHRHAHRARRVRLAARARPRRAAHRRRARRQDAPARSSVRRGVGRFAVVAGMWPRGEVLLVFAALGQRLTVDGAPLVDRDGYAALLLRRARHHRGHAAAPCARRSPASAT